jgi:2-(1,2-epoxy-1,2-dihydrophenyl)acetyl-CoA isomerase
MTTTEQVVQLELSSGIARLSLNRPENGNAINRALVAELREHAESLHRRDDVRVVILRGQGPTFCVGGDLTYFAATEDVETELLELAADFHAGIDALRRLPAPVIAGVQGAAAGGGLSLVCQSDLAIAAESARFTMAYTAAGLSPDGGASWFLPRIVGLRMATEMLLTNRVLKAPEAAAIGLVNSVVADDALDAEVEALAAKLASGATAAYGTVKALLRASATRTLEQQLQAEAREIARHASLPDGREGVDAFLNKRTPQFGQR